MSPLLGPVETTTPLESEVGEALDDADYSSNVGMWEVIDRSSDAQLGS